ncbi:zinc-ribbon domain containing protein [Dethiosulfatarculus sandiegensis]|uniref:zinc-ribbon domain containing protein n=1 Tax=Dethiosulfatarculus sandiegensis TaxID=1429043 RepID=UPI0009E712B5|nr:zinc-ribbon domain containing protein [Dethiosulfatarculus sandiegensis]
MSRQDQFRVCVQCNRTFKFGKHEQERYESMGFDPPLRCPECRKNKQKTKTENKWAPRQRRSQKNWDLEDY